MNEVQAIDIIRAVYEIVVAAGSMGVPSGHLYAALMTYGCTLAQYEQIEAMMLRVGMLRKQGLLLIANQPGQL